MWRWGVGGGLDPGPFILLHGQPARQPDQGSAPALMGWSRRGRPSPVITAPCYSGASPLPPTGSWGLVWDPLSLRLQSGWERRGSIQGLVSPIGWVLLSRGPGCGLVGCSACPPQGGTSLSPPPSEPPPPPERGEAAASGASPPAGSQRTQAGPVGLSPQKPWSQRSPAPALGTLEWAGGLGLPGVRRGARCTRRVLQARQGWSACR